MMPTFVTKEQYSCGHVLEICQKRTGDDKFVRTETVPVPYQCLTCAFGGVSSTDGASVPPSRVADLRQHFSAVSRTGRLARGQAPRCNAGACRPARPSMAELGRAVAWW